MDSSPSVDISSCIDLTAKEDEIDYIAVEPAVAKEDEIDDSAVEPAAAEEDEIDDSNVESIAAFHDMGSEMQKKLSRSSEIPKAAPGPMNSVSCQTCPTSHPPLTPPRLALDQWANKAFPRRLHTFSSQTPPSAATSQAATTYSYLGRRLSHKSAQGAQVPALTSLQSQNPILNARLASGNSAFARSVRLAQYLRELEMERTKKVWMNRGLPVDEESLGAAASKDAFDLRDLSESLPSSSASSPRLICRRLRERWARFSDALSQERNGATPEERTISNWSRYYKHRTIPKSNASIFGCDSLESRISARRALLRKLTIEIPDIPSASESDIEKSLLGDLPSSPLICTVCPSELETKTDNSLKELKETLDQMLTDFDPKNVGEDKMTSPNWTGLFHKEATEDGRNSRFAKTCHVFTGCTGEAVSEDSSDANGDKAQRNLTCQGQETIRSRWSVDFDGKNPYSWVRSDGKAEGLSSPTESRSQLLDISLDSSLKSRDVQSTGYRMPFNSPDKTKDVKAMNEILTLSRVLAEMKRKTMATMRAESKFNAQNSHRGISIEDIDDSASRPKPMSSLRILALASSQKIPRYSVLNYGKESEDTRSSHRRSSRLVAWPFRESAKDMRRARCPVFRGNDKVVPD